MLKLEDIEITSRIFDDGSKEYRGKLEMRTYHRISAYELNNITDTEGLESHIKESITHRIWHELYGDLIDDIFELLHEVKRNTDPRYDTTDLQRLVQKIKAKLK